METTKERRPGCRELPTSLEPLASAHHALIIHPQGGRGAAQRPRRPAPHPAARHRRHCGDFNFSKRYTLEFRNVAFSATLSQRSPPMTITLHRCHVEPQHWEKGRSPSRISFFSLKAAPLWWWPVFPTSLCTRPLGTRTSNGKAGHLRRCPQACPQVSVKTQARLSMDPDRTITPGLPGTVPVCVCFLGLLTSSMLVPGQPQAGQETTWSLSAPPRPKSCRPRPPRSLVTPLVVRPPSLGTAPTGITPLPVSLISTQWCPGTCRSHSLNVVPSSHGLSANPGLRGLPHPGPPPPLSPGLAPDHSPPGGLGRPAGHLSTCSGVPLCRPRLPSLMQSLFSWEDPLQPPLLPKADRPPWVPASSPLTYRTFL